MEEKNVQIPEGWEEKTLSNICNISKGVQLNKLDLENTGLFPCINGGILPSGYTDKCNRNANTITISEGGNSCGYVNLIAANFWSGGHCYTLLELNKMITNNFLYHALKGRQSLLMDLRVGSGLPNIQQKAIKEFKIIFPKSITEQKQIAEILSKVDEAIDQTQSLIAKYKRIKTGLMQDLLTKGIDENGNIRSEETHEFKDSELGRIPIEWDCFSLQKISLQIIDCPHSTPKYIDEGYLVARTQNIKNGEYLIETSSYLSHNDYNERVSRLEPKSGDIIFTREAPIGEAFVIPQGMKIALGQRVMLFRLNSKIIIPEFLVELIYSDEVQIYFTNIVAGTTVSHLNVKDVKELLFKVPIIMEQNRIMSLLLKHRESISVSTLKIQKLQSLKAGLMHDLLSGKKRVTSLLNKEHVS